MPTRPASRPSRKAGTVAVLLPGAFYFLRETQKPPVDLLRKHGVPIAISSDSNPGTSPLTSLLLTMNMAATFFRLTVDECLLGVTRQAARALGRLDQVGTLEAGKSCDLAIWDIERPAELVYRIGFTPLHQRVWRGRVIARRDDACATGATSIAAPCPRSIRPAIRPSSARPPRSSAIIAKGEPVYGINTGFGKLASVRIPPADLATLQRNIVLSHAAGVGAPMPVAGRAADDGAQARQPGARRVGRAAARPCACSKRCWPRA